MILVLLGTQDKPFTRLLDSVQEQIELGNIKEEVIVQKGCTPFKSNDMKLFDLIAMDELDKLVKSANIIITHGGVGSILNGLQYNKKIIVCPRLKKYKEHTNDHQLEIVENFYKEGYILKLDETDSLENVLHEIKKFKPKKYQSNTNNMIQLIEKFIEEN